MALVFLISLSGQAFAQTPSGYEENKKSSDILCTESALIKKLNKASCFEISPEGELEIDRQQVATSKQSGMITELVCNDKERSSYSFHFLTNKQQKLFRVYDTKLPPTAPSLLNLEYDKSGGCYDVTNKPKTPARAVVPQGSPLTHPDGTK